MVIKVSRSNVPADSDVLLGMTRMIENLSRIPAFKFTRPDGKIIKLIILKNI